MWLGELLLEAVALVGEVVMGKFSSSEDEEDEE